MPLSKIEKPFKYVSLEWVVYPTPSRRKGGIKKFHRCPINASHSRPELMVKDGKSNDKDGMSERLSAG